MADVAISFPSEANTPVYSSLEPDNLIDFESEPITVDSYIPHSWQPLVITNAFRNFTAVLTGTPDIDIPISYFSITRTADSVSAVDCTTPTLSQQDGINDRIGGNLQIRKDYVKGGSVIDSETIVSVPFESFDYTIAARSQSILLRGRGTETITTKSVTIEQLPAYLQRQSGKLNVIFYETDMHINPGDTVYLQWGGYNFVVGKIRVSFSSFGRSINEKFTLTEA